VPSLVDSPTGRCDTQIDWIEYWKSGDERSWKAMQSFFEEIFQR